MNKETDEITMSNPKQIKSALASDTNRLTAEMHRELLGNLLAAKGLNEFFNARDLNEFSNECTKNIIEAVEKEVGIKFELQGKIVTKLESDIHKIVKHLNTTIDNEVTKYKPLTLTEILEDKESSATFQKGLHNSAHHQENHQGFEFIFQRLIAYLKSFLNNEPPKLESAVAKFIKNAEIGSVESNKEKHR